MSRIPILVGQRTSILLVVLVIATMLLVLMAAQVSPAEASNGSYYTVQRGDTLYSLARRYNTTATAIASANNIANPNLTYAGSVLWIPAGVSPPVNLPEPVCRIYHTVTWGDTLNKLGA